MVTKGQGECIYDIDQDGSDNLMHNTGVSMKKPSWVSYL